MGSGTGTMDQKNSQQDFFNNCQYLFAYPYQGFPVRFQRFYRQSAQRIFSYSTINGFAFDVEIFVLAKKLGLSIEKLPVTLITNQHTKVRLTRDPFRMFMDILKLSCRQWSGGIFR